MPIIKTVFKELEQKEFKLEEELKKLEDSDRRDLNIIALFVKEKNLDIRNKSQLNAVIGRHIKPAQHLMSFENDQIFRGMEIAEAEYPLYWTLETVLKKIIS